MSLLNKVIMVLLIATSTSQPMKTELVKDYSKIIDSVTFSNFNVNNEFVFKVGSNDPIHISIQNRQFTTKSILRGQIYSRHYTISSKGDMAYINDDSLCVIKNNKKYKIEEPPCGSPAWSPNGEMLAYLYNESICLVNKDLSRKIVVSKGKRIGYPLWVDDNALLFIRDGHIIYYNHKEKVEKQVTVGSGFYKQLCYDRHEREVYYVEDGKVDFIKSININSRKEKVILKGYYRLIGIMHYNNEKGLCLIDKSNTLLFYSIKSGRASVLANDVFDAVLNDNSKVILYCSIENKIFLSWY